MAPPGAGSDASQAGGSCTGARQGRGAGELGCVLGDPAGSWTCSCACPNESQRPLKLSA